MWDAASDVNVARVGCARTAAPQMIMTGSSPPPHRIQYDQQRFRSAALPSVTTGFAAVPQERDVVVNHRTAKAGGFPIADRRLGEELRNPIDRRRSPASEQPPVFRLWPERGRAGIA